MIYLDHNASSPLRPEVLQGMIPYFGERYGNPSSVHAAGRACRQGVDEARRRLAEQLAVHESQIIFTSGGTEANNLALYGQAARHLFQGHILLSAVEHPSVLQCAERLRRHGIELGRIPVDSAGVVQLDELQAQLRSNTILVAVMQANNETGVVQPVEAIARICRLRGIPLLCDAVQSFAKMEIPFNDWQLSLLSLSAHKFGGPKGIGALVVDKPLAVEPLLSGGGQERGRRSGTENVPGIVGFALAAALAGAERPQRVRQWQEWQKQCEQRLQEAIPEIQIAGQAAERLANTTALLIPGVHGETLVMSLDLEGIAISSGSACASGRSRPSSVLLEMGFDPELATSMVRISMGWNTTEEEMERFTESLIKGIKRLLHW
ncbi:cysteine desulfurase family protein [Candidatus Magnetaquicoccus inordinatus]|uniref:cysteine desulfurase family protein n=1 Tax=Candidatus Magnetaquicoccus inordinatus TaxID=2496818 RepID=UPI00102CF75C|nr:cysteine desulfurase family protein [Candidatus Magnetaquicoccus inordinatus]